jgi:hypothetical protein
MLADHGDSEQAWRSAGQNYQIIRFGNVGGMLAEQDYTPRRRRGRLKCTLKTCAMLVAPKGAVYVL